MVNKREGSIPYKLRSITADLVRVQMTKTSPRGSLLSDLPICQNRCIRYSSTSIDSRGRIITSKICESHLQKGKVRVTPRFQSERFGHPPLRGRRAATIYLRGSPISYLLYGLCLGNTRLPRARRQILVSQSSRTDLNHNVKYHLTLDDRSNMGPYYRDDRVGISQAAPCHICRFRDLRSSHSLLF